jgi:predicted permease
VAFSLTPAKLKEMWIIPLGYVLANEVCVLELMVDLLSLLDYPLLWLGFWQRCSSSSDHKRQLKEPLILRRADGSAFAICAAMFQNSNSLPIALIQSLVVEVPGLKWGHDDTKDQMLGRALTYLVLYSTLGMMVRILIMDWTDDSSDGHGE